jgi:hypothetical protein
METLINNFNEKINITNTIIEIKNITNDEVILTNDELITTNDEVITTNDEVITTNDEVITTNDEVITTNDEVITTNEVDNTTNEVNNTNQNNDIQILENDITKIIYDCNYIKNCKSNKKKDFNSLTFLIEKNVSQSDCIKLGIGFEKITEQTILEYTKFVNIKPINKKGFKEKDHLFMDNKNKIIYYAELKANLNLDTEKSKSTINKCLFINEELKKKYPEYIIKWCLLGYRYISKEVIPKTIFSRYKSISDNIFGINDYYEMLNINFSFTEKSYKEYLNKIVDAMFYSS